MVVKKTAAKTPAARAAEALAMLKRKASPKYRADMGPRYGIYVETALGTPMAEIKLIAKSLGRDHALAEALWRTGVYDARLLASLVDEPEKLTAAQMDRWRRDFDNWGVTDTLCFNLFDKTPHAFAKAMQWAKLKGEFDKRAGFALMACLALHRKAEADAPFLAMLPLIETGAADERNFVKKGVSWALRAIGLRKSAVLKREALALAKRLAASENAAARWVGKGAVRDLAKR